MLKLMYFIFLISFIVKFLILRCASFTCIHDQIVEQKRPTLLRRSIKYQEVREQRDKDPNLFEPLSVHFYVDNFDTKLSANVIHNIELALRRVSDYIAETFKGLCLFVLSYLYIIIFVLVYYVYLAENQIYQDFILCSSSEWDHQKKFSKCACQNII